MRSGVEPRLLNEQDRDTDMAGTIYDVAIVGAGAAGLGAAREARERGLSYVVLEAMDRIGGRAHTESATFGTPWDRGCH